MREISDKLRNQVKLLAGLGISDKDISRIIDLPEATLQRRCREELNNGRAQAKAKVAQTAYNMAVSGKWPAMTMFWLKTQCEWREVHNSENKKPSADDEGKPYKIVRERLPDNGRENPE